MKERELRRDSVIIHGRPNSDVNTTCTDFKEIFSDLINKEMSLSEPVYISKK